MERFNRTNHEDAVRYLKEVEAYQDVRLVPDTQLYATSDLEDGSIEFLTVDELCETANNLADQR